MSTFWIFISWDILLATPPQTFWRKIQWMRTSLRVISGIYRMYFWMWSVPVFEPGLPSASLWISMSFETIQCFSPLVLLECSPSWLNSAANTEDGAEACEPIRLLPPTCYKIYYVKEESRVTTSAWIPFLELIGSLHPSGWVVQSEKGARRHHKESAVTADYVCLQRTSKTTCNFMKWFLICVAALRRKHPIFMRNRGGLIAEVCRTRPLPR